MEYDIVRNFVNIIKQQKDFFTEKRNRWHRTRGSEAENKREQSVLDRLTDAQKNANTTRGSTPGLINPTLGDVFGNRIALPSVVLKKRGPRRRAGNSKNTPATQLEQPAQALPVPQAPQDQNGYQNQQFPQSARAIRHDAMTPPLLDPSTTIEMPSQNLAGVAGGPVIHTPTCNRHQELLLTFLSG